MDRSGWTYNPSGLRCLWQKYLCHYSKMGHSIEGAGEVWAGLLKEQPAEGIVTTSVPLFWCLPHACKG